jgi:hypothetical protein
LHAEQQEKRAREEKEAEQKRDLKARLLAELDLKQA